MILWCNSIYMDTTYMDTKCVKSSEKIKPPR